MYKIFILFAIISLILVGCSQEIESEPTTKKNEETHANTKLIDLELKELEVIDVIKKAVSDSKKEPGIVNMTNPQYQFSIGEETYFLWITEKSGTIMNTKDTHTIYTLSDSSVKEIFELVNKE